MSNRRRKNKSFLCYVPETTFGVFPKELLMKKNECPATFLVKHDLAYRFAVSKENTLYLLVEKVAAAWHLHAMTFNQKMAEWVLSQSVEMCEQQKQTRTYAIIEVTATRDDFKTLLAASDHFIF